MRSFAPAFLLALIPFFLSAQATLVRSAPSDTFDLACPSCTLAVKDLAVLAGQQWIPFDVRRGDVQNLLHWRYYDRFLEREAIFPREMRTEPCTQLLDDQPDTMLLSLHIVMIWTDSAGRQNDLYLLVSGLTKEQLSDLPIHTFCDSDPYMAPRFAAVARTASTNGLAEVFDAVEGALTITAFDPKKATIAGEFSFEGNCIGWLKMGYFRRGSFGK